MPLEVPKAELASWEDRWRELAGAVYLAAEGGEAGPVEHLGRGVPDLLHGELDAAGGLIPAVRAGHVGGLAGAGDRRQRAVEHPHDLPR